MPTTKPITKPNKGTTKNPTTPTTPPIRRVDVGTAARRIRRTGHRYLTAVVVATIAVTIPSVTHDATVCTTTAHTAIAAYTNSIPGSSGRTIPTSPTAIASPTRSSPAALITARAPACPALRRRPAPAGPLVHPIADTALAVAVSVPPRPAD